MLMKFGSVPTLVISSARLAEEVTKNQDLVFCSRPKMVGQQRLRSYGGLDVAFAPYNQDWRERRKICVVHLLSTKRIQQFRPIREDEMSRMIEKIRKDALTRSNKDTNLSEMLQSVTSTMICRIVFGKRIDPESPQKKGVDVIFKEMPTLFLGFFFSDYFPCIGWLDHVTGMRSRLERIFHKVDSFFQELIDEHLDPNRPESMDDDLIDIMLQLQRDGSSTSSHVTMDHIKAMLMNVFIAATHASASTVIWAMTLLMKNPGIMQKLQTEIRQAMGAKAMLDEDDVAGLPYLAATVKETFRLFSVAPLLLPRMTMKKCRIDGYEIERETVVYINAWAMGRDPEMWENTEEFSPERFLKSEKSIELNGEDFELIPFGSGRRRCPGHYMGMKTVHLLLANLLHSFDWELPSGMTDLDTESSPGLAMDKKIALKLVAKIPM